MKHLVEFTLENGSTLLMEAEDSISEEGTVFASSHPSSHGITKVSNKTFEESIEIIKPVTDTILNKLKDTYNKPDEIEVSFGISMDFKAGMFISANTGSSFNVTLKWNNKNQ